jgi:hypothetical protein
MSLRKVAPASLLLLMAFVLVWHHFTTRESDAGALASYEPVPGYDPFAEPLMASYGRYAAELGLSRSHGEFEVRRRIIDRDR